MLNTDTNLKLSDNPMLDTEAPDKDRQVLPTRQPNIRVLPMPADTNSQGDIFGGWMVGQMDLAASIVAALRSEGRAVTVAIDGLGFRQPVYVGDELSIYATLKTVGRSSMTINVEAWRRDIQTDLAQQVTHAIFTFVAVDESGKPRTILAKESDLDAFFNDYGQSESSSEKLDK